MFAQLVAQFSFGEELAAHGPIVTARGVTLGFVGISGHGGTSEG